MQTIRLSLDDDINSICDLLDWSDDKRVVFVLPEEETAKRDFDKLSHRGSVETARREPVETAVLPPVVTAISLIRLRRYADNKRIEVGLVTGNRQLARQARGLGLPAFTTVEEAEMSRRGWWRGRRRQERLGLPTYGEPLDDGKPRPSTDDDELLPTSAVTKRQWAIRYAAILLFFVAGALGVVSFLYLVPRATIMLQPELAPLTAVQQITAVPALQTVDYSQNAIPARLLTLTQSWQTDVETTGVVEVPAAPARGLVVFTNLTEETVTVPAGTIIQTEDGLGFQTVADVSVAGVEGSTAETDAIALEPGPQGNVSAESLTVLPAGLIDLLEVRNPAPMVGGDVRAEAAVSQEDLNRVRSQALQFLQAVAQSQMEGMLTEREFLARESLRVVEIVSETYSHQVGEQTAQISVEMEAVLQGTAVDTTAASGLVYEALAGQVRPGFTLVPESIQFGEAEVVSADEAGNVTFLLSGTGAAATNLNLDETLAAIAGQETGTAAAYLYENLPLTAVPTIQIWPLWVKRIPYLPRRIETEIRTDS
ncbi:MAG: baseplate J/gp47 family protein [Ardenticatenaceae bacterium]|nr:baseplate J/gp47 family protein [Ardenticatenaceae bacterium]MCB9444902.1 baseplate J/gp47 family protein [Ardenticatenaceae bacterium]